MTVLEQINNFCKEAKNTIPAFVYSAIVDANTGEVLGACDTGIGADLSYELACCANMVRISLDIIHKEKNDNSTLLREITIESDSCVFYIIMSPKNKFFYTIGYLREGGNLGLAVASLNKGRAFMERVLEA